MKLCNLVVPLHFFLLYRSVDLLETFFLFWCLCLAQGMRPKVEWNNFNSEWCVSFFFLFASQVIYLKKFNICYFEANLSVLNAVTISLNPTAFYLASPAVFPPPLIPLANLETASDSPKYCFGFSCSSARGSECWGFSLWYSCDKAVVVISPA